MKSWTTRAWTAELRRCHYNQVLKVLSKSIPSLHWSVFENAGSMCVRAVIEGHPRIRTLAADYCIEGGMHNVGLIVDSMIEAWTELQYDIWRHNECSS